MEKRNLLSRGFQKKKRIVIHRHVPEICMREPLDIGEIAEKPTRQVDDMDALVDQLTATGQLRPRPPFPFVPNSSAVPVPGSQEHQRSECAGVDDTPGMPESAMVAVVEPYANAHLVVVRHGN
jgi:hypothetical protein